MNIKSRLIRQILIFIPVVAGMSLFFNYPDTLLKPPQSIHNWRQCDGASLALNYYKNGMRFFHPQTHMLYSDDHTTGYSAPSELPVLYYFVAVLYKIFGYHEYLFRGFNLLVFFAGLFYLFRVADEMLDSYLWSGVVTALIFSSPVLIYYANNFLPNTTALSFSFIGWFYFYRYYRDHKTRTFLLSMLFFAVAGSLKITELTGPVIILILMVTDYFGFAGLNLNGREKTGVKLAAVAGIFVVVAGWVFYAKYYNNLHNSVQFQTYTTAIWSIEHEDIDLVLQKMRDLWFVDYFYPPTFWFMLLCILLIPVFRKRGDPLLNWASLGLTAALIAFSLLWFHQLGDHDYFYTGFYLLPAFAFINFFVVLQSFRFNKLVDFTIKTVFILVVIMNVYYGKQRHILRYTSWMNDYPQTKDLYTIDADNLGIQKNEKIIFYPSRYIRPLYLMDREGWVIQEHNEVNRKIEHRDSILMHTFTAKGAQYFVTNDLQSASAYKPFQPYMKEPHSKYKSVYIFKISHADNKPEPDTYN